MPRELVPELHDILKLTGHHSYPPSRPLPISLPLPETATWHGVFYHSSRGPVDAKILRLQAADWLAAGTSRPSVEGRGGRWSTHKLWLAKRSTTAPTVDLAEVVEFMCSDPDWQEFLARYAEQAAICAENAAEGLNITSLLRHMQLTGKFYRLLAGCRELTLAEEKLRQQDAQGAREEIVQKQITVSHLKVHFPQRPVRARDLNVLAALANAARGVAERYPDNVIFSTEEELLVVSTDELTRKALEEEIVAQGFWLTARDLSTSIKKWTGRDIAHEAERKNEGGKLLLGLIEEPTRTVYPDLPASIAPPLCEICQMAAGSQRWVVEEREEWLCERCYEYRKHEARLPRLANWIEGEASARLGWLRVDLPLDSLISSLGVLYQDYLKSLGASAEPEVRFSLIAEFQPDYIQFLEGLHKGLMGRLGEENVQEVLPTLYCVRLERLDQALDMLEVYEAEVKRVMPAFAQPKRSPLQTRLVVSGPKFPFGEVWRMMQQPGAEVEVNLVGSRNLRTTLAALPRILTLRGQPLRQSALHSLAEIARLSETLAQLRWRDRGDRDGKTYARIDQHLDAADLDFEGLLAFAQMQQISESPGARETREEADGFSGI